MTIVNIANYFIGKPSVVEMSLDKMACHHSPVAEHLPHYLTVKGLSPTRRKKKGKKIIYSKGIQIFCSQDGCRRDVFRQNGMPP
jgi:hypothetical protein